MNRYIDYDAIDYRNDKMHDKSSDFIDGVVYMAERIEEAPSIDLADYVPKDFHDKTCEAMAKRHTEEIQRLMPKHGEWIWDNDAVDWNLGAWICSNCHARNDNIPHSERIIPLRWSGSKFCPNCGADMRGENNETDKEMR